MAVGGKGLGDIVPPDRFSFLGQIISETVIPASIPAAWKKRETVPQRIRFRFALHVDQENNHQWNYLFYLRLWIPDCI